MKSPALPPRQIGCCTRRCFYFSLIICFSFLFILFLLIGGTGPYIINYFMNIEIQKMLLLNGNTSTAYPGWVESIPLNYSFYMFNVTNPDQVLDGAIPILKEMGPYCYSMNKTHFDILFSSDNSYVQAHTCFLYTMDFYHPDCKDATKDYVTVVNGPWAAVRASVENTQEWWKALTFDVLATAADAYPFVTVHPHEIFWGYDAPFLVFINNTVKPISSTNFGIKFNCSSFEAQRVHDHMKPDQYWTGISDTLNAFSYKEWQGQSKLPFWGSPEANALYGTDGTSFRPNLLKKPILSIFADGVYRRVEVNCNSTVIIKGITMNDYQVPPSEFANVSTNPAYYLHGPPGLINITQPLLVTQGIAVPMFISKPYFLDADPYYTEQVDFLDQREREQIDSHFYIEPYTGVMMHGYRRLQVNVQIKESFLLYPHLNKIIFPMCWTELTGMIGDDQVTQFKDGVYKVIWFEKIVQIVGFVLSGLCLIFIISFSIYFGIQKKTNYQQIN